VSLSIGIGVTPPADTTVRCELCGTTLKCKWVYAGSGQTWILADYCRRCFPDELVRLIVAQRDSEVSPSKP
jgi:hypothetical protein